MPKLLLEGVQSWKRRTKLYKNSMCFQAFLMTSSLQRDNSICLT